MFRKIFWYAGLALLLIWINPVVFGIEGDEAWTGEGWGLVPIVDNAYVRWTFPPIFDPENAPHPIPLPKMDAGQKRGNAALARGYEPAALETDRGCSYAWHMVSPIPINVVRDYYANLLTLEPTTIGTKFIFQYTPAQAADGEDIKIQLFPDPDPIQRGYTSLILTEERVEAQKITPSMRHSMEFLGFAMVLGGFYSLWIDRLFEWILSGWQWIILRSKSPLYYPVTGTLGGLWYDPVRQNHWDGFEKTMQDQGYSKVCDCVHTSVIPREYGRVMHRHGQVYGMAMFANKGRKRQVWVEFFSLFADGSAVYTTSHRDPEFRRPKEYPLFQVPESADFKQIMNVHLQNVEGHGGQLAMVGPDKILTVLSQLERTVKIHRPSEVKKITLADQTLAPKAEPTEPPPMTDMPLPVGPHAKLPVGPHAQKELKAPPPLATAPPVPAPDAVNPITAAMAEYVVNKEASVLGIAAVAATEKAEEHEALKAEQAAKEEFKADVIARIRQLVPDDMEIKERDVLSLVIVMDRNENELDLETPYYMSKSNPESRAKIINGVAQRVKQGAF
ncbi:MAG TPA: hypothetical protein VGO93_23020 [Candidatus Xenobia bacterium]|jgi:hypothetical protein